MSVEYMSHCEFLRKIGCNERIASITAKEIVETEKDLNEAILAFYETLRKMLYGIDHLKWTMDVVVLLFRYVGYMRMTFYKEIPYDDMPVSLDELETEFNMLWKMVYTLA